MTLLGGAPETCYLSYCALERKTFGGSIAQHQAVQFMLAEMAISYEATRLLTHKAAWQVDSGELSSITSSYARAYLVARIE